MGNIISIRHMRKGRSICQKSDTIDFEQKSNTAFQKHLGETCKWIQCDINISSVIQRFEWLTVLNREPWLLAANVLIFNSFWLGWQMRHIGAVLTLYVLNWLKKDFINVILFERCKVLKFNINGENDMLHFKTSVYCPMACMATQHDDVIKWKHFPRYWPFVRGIHQSPVNSPHKGQWRGALMFSLMCAWINGWVNKREAGNLIRHCTHYDVIIMNALRLVSENHRKISSFPDF